MLLYNQVRSPALTLRVQLGLKRAIDICGSAVLLVILSPVLLVAWLWILFTMGSPGVFRQQRGGYRGRVFVLYKLRTMTAECDATGQFLPDCQRLTIPGRVLRQLSIDEIPQLWNVLKGDMSLVGPRPLLASYLPRYNSFHMRRHDVRPGLTGWAQVASRQSQCWEDRFDYDVWYVSNWSLLLDLNVALKTLRMVFSKQRLVQAGSPTDAEFLGTSDPTRDDVFAPVRRKSGN